MFEPLQNHYACLYDKKQKQWLSFARPILRIEARQTTEVLPLLETVQERARKEGLYALGFLAYEAAPAMDTAFASAKPSSFPLAYFALYDQVEKHSSLGFADKRSCPPIVWQSALGKENYLAKLEEIRSWIAAGLCYQINYSYRLKGRFKRAPVGSYALCLWHIFQDMLRGQGECYGAFLHLPEWIICSASPELFFALEENGELLARPMKGTAARGPSFADDIRQAEELSCSCKERAENAMILDMVRSDIGRIAQFAQVRTEHIFQVEQYASLWQMTSGVRAKSNASLAEIFQALFPAASVTGAPKRKSIELIEKLEESPREIYTGAIGFLNPQGRAQFSVAIRTLWLDKKKQEFSYGVGSGVVWDSQALQEWRECQTKSKILKKPPPPFYLLETMLWTKENGCFLLPYHIQRLKESARYFSYPLDLSLLHAKLKEIELCFKKSRVSLDQKVRLLLDAKGHFFWESAPIESQRGKEKIWKLFLAAKAMDPQNPFFYHKTSYRKIYERPRAMLKARKTNLPPYYDVLLWNPKKEVTESSFANVVIEWHGELYTPPIACGLLGGTYRAFLLEQKKIKERVFTIDEIKQKPAMYLINSVRKMMPAELSL